MEINGREYAEFHKRLRFSNLLSLAGDSPVEVFVYGGIHIEGRILEHSVDDEQASLLVDCEGFVMMLDVGNITHIEYVPDTDRFTLQVKERTGRKFQPIITLTEVTEYLADTLLDDLEQRAEDEHEEVPEWLASIVDPDTDVYVVDEHTGIPGCLCPNCLDSDEDDDDIDGDDFGAHHYETEEEGGEDTGE